LAIGVPKVALIDIEGGTTISLSFVAPTEVGSAMTTTTNNSIWRNYSSTTSKGQTNSITARVSLVLPGVNLRLGAAAYYGSRGGGTVGATTGTKTLTASNQTVISSIGTCYTRNGVNKGHRLVYSLTVANYALIKYASGTTLTVTYTITNN
jgi:hypothetical protein